MGLRSAITLAVLAVLAAGPARSAILQVGPGQPFAKPSQAIAEARDGDTIDIAPGRYYDCAVVRQNNLTIQGAGPGAVMTETTCMGKAILITNGNNITLRNLTLQRARVPDENGAGIRAQGGNLTIEGVKFLNNQDGILTTSNPKADITIVNSEFVHNGLCAQACAHGIYAGFIHALKVEHTRFFDTQQGHSIKSQALATAVIDCDIEDGPGGTSSYLIDVPHGGSLLVRGNKLEKGPKSGNHSVAISIGEGSVTQPTDSIVIEDNTFTNDNAQPTIFVRNVTARPAELINNKLNGQVRPLDGDGKVS
ncbi:MAG TPA: right-handed parallel beta-helix repeat-containing protein [Acetobacteraceae bacterium]|nr:right-handed parallel beta-helix repeat-containing protein [Acetobacteraceae bacterium]